MKRYSDNNHVILHGDAIEALQTEIEDGSIDFIFADPPYNIGKDFKSTKDNLPEEQYLEWAYKWLDLCVRKLKPHGSFYVMTSTQFMPYFDLHLRKSTSILSRIIWSYDSSGVQAKNYFGSLYEPILFVVKDEKNYTFNINDILVEAKTGSERKLIDYRKAVPVPYNTKKVPGNVWNLPRVRYRMEEYEDHPTQKPEALLERIIKASSNEGDVVLDPFSGTFTTSAVAKKLNRKSIAIELEDEYVKIGLRRLGLKNELDGKPLVRQEKTYERRNGMKNLKVAV